MRSHKGPKSLASGVKTALTEVFGWVKGIESSGEIKGRVKIESRALNRHRSETNIGGGIIRSTIYHPFNAAKIFHVTVSRDGADLAIENSAGRSEY